MRLPLIRALAAAICSLFLVVPAAAQAQAEPPCGGDTLVLGSSFGWDMTADADCSGIPPTARFTMTPTATTPGGTVQFDATTSADTGGFIATYEWDLDGDGAFDDSALVAPTWPYPAKGSYAVALRVTDNEGLTDTVTQNLPVTVSPVADVTATPASPLTDETFTLDASASDDPDGVIVGYTWDTNADGEADRDTQGTPTLDLSFPFAGTYDVTVTVTDDTGATASKTVQVVVRNRPPEPAIDDPGLVLSGRVTALSAASSVDPDLPAGAGLTYEWDLDGDGIYDTAPDTSATIDHTFTATGPVTVGVRVTDEASAQATTTRSLVVTHAPVVSLTATPTPASFDEAVTLDASGSSDPDGAGALTYEWEVEDDDGATLTPTAGAQLTTSWAKAGTRTVTVTVTDASGAKTEGSVDVVVRNQAPTAAIAATPASPRVGTAVQLSAAGASDPDGSVVRYQWDLDGDGGYEVDTQATPSASATFANPGTLTVGVRVTDDDGGTGTKSVALTVLPAEEAPPTQDPVQNKPTGSQTTTGTAPPAGGGDTPTEPAGEPTQSGFTPTPERPFGAWVGGNPIQRTPTVISRGLLVSCRAEPAVWCAVTATISAADAKRLKLGRKATVVARTAIPVPAGESARARVKLTARARRALRGKGGVRVLVHAVATAADGREVALNRVILVRG
jgi:PKD repeat protein